MSLYHVYHSITCWDPCPGWGCSCHCHDCPDLPDEEVS